jgi:hypothetical protein
VGTEAPTAPVADVTVPAAAPAAAAAPMDGSVAPVLKLEGCRQPSGDGRGYHTTVG